MASCPVGVAHRLARCHPVVQVPPGERVGAAQAGDVAGEADPAAVGAGARPEVDDVVGDGDGLRFVLHHQHGVALVAQPQQQVVHPGDVVRVQADCGFVEDVRDVGEAGAEVPDHFHPLRLPAGEGR